MTALHVLKGLVFFIGLYHLVLGAGLMFSHEFQRFCVATYGASFDWNVRDIYFIRIVGSFAFVLGSLALVASRDPMKYRLFLFCFIEFFVLRDIHRHLYSEELYTGFSISPTMNVITSIVFGAQALALFILIVITRRSERIA